MALVKRHRRGVAVVAATVLLAMAVAFLLTTEGDQEPSPVPSTASIENLQIVQLTTSGTAGLPAISPDGTYGVYIQTEGNQSSLWIRQTTTPSNAVIFRPEPGVFLLGATVTPDGV